MAACMSRSADSRYLRETTIGEIDARNAKTRAAWGKPKQLSLREAAAGQKVEAADHTQTFSQGFTPPQVIAKKQPAIRPKQTVEKSWSSGFEAMLRGAKLPAPQYEFQFNAARKWRFDIAFAKQRIAIEVDGGIWREDRGAHGRPANILRDMEKGNAAQLAGWKYLRYTPDNLMRAVDDIRRCLHLL